MKIQRGIVKYKDRSDIVCTYALTDDGKQYYFLDETDTKRFTNGNRIASTALVEAIDPMVKAEHVGIIDESGAIVVPFDNRSIRPVNDNVILVEKAVRSDTTAAATLVSTAATIKDRLNAQMGVEGKYIFNDQFSEATICDINGTNLVNGEQYSFISLANDKLYLSKNTADSAISEFSLTTYELSTATTEAIDVASAGVDPQVVEGALASQTTVDVQDAVVPVDEELVTDPVDTVVSSEVTDNTPVDVSNVVGASETTDVVETVNAEPTTEGTENVEPTEEKKEDVIMSFIEPEDEGAKTDSTEVKEDVIMSFIEPEDGKSEGESTLNTVTTLSEGESVVDGIPYDNTVNNVEFSTENASPATEGEFSATDTSISDDLKAFANGAPSLGEEPASEEIKVEETTKDDTSSVPEDVSTTTTTTTDDAVVAITDDVVEEPTTETGDEEEEIPPIVEEEDKSSDDMPSVPVEEHDDEEAVDGAAPIVPLVEEEDDKSVQDDDVVEQTFSDTVKKLSDEEDDEKTLPEPVTIDAETVLATVDRNKNGIIDSDEIMVPQPKNTESPRDVLEPTPATTSLSDIFGIN